jgi:flagella basal body P-ring formation protein FlgA
MRPMRPPFRTPIERPTRLAIAIAALGLVLALANRASAEPLEAIVRDKLGPAMPAGLGVAKLYLPVELAAIDTAPARVVIELPRELRAGRPSIKLTVRGHRTVWVPVVIAALGDVAIAQRALAPGDVIGTGDLAIERRAIAEVSAAAPGTVVGASVVHPIAAGAVVVARDVSLPPPLGRGTQIAIDVRRGAVHVRGTGTLETAARPGEPASARLAATKIVVHGRLVAPATLVVGESP